MESFEFLFFIWLLGVDMKKAGPMAQKIWLPDSVPCNIKMYQPMKKCHPPGRVS
jgi:hypothetical protein